MSQPTPGDVHVFRYTNPVSSAAIQDPRAVALTGAQSLASSAILTGVADTPLGIFSGWFKLRAAQAMTFAQAAHSTTVYNKISISAAGAVEFRAAIDATPTKALIGHSSDGDMLTDGTAQHLLLAWDTNHAIASRILAAYVNDVALSFTLDSDIGTGGWSVPFTSADLCTFLASVVGDVTDIYYAPGQFLDPTVTGNRRKFITAGLKPVFLGAGGILPTGTKPAVFLEGPVSAFANAGTGGALTLTGALTDSTTGFNP